MFDILYIQIIFVFILLGGVFARYLFKKTRDESTNVKNDITLIVIAVISLVILDIFIYIMR